MPTFLEQNYSKCVNMFWTDFLNVNNVGHDPLFKKYKFRLGAPGAMLAIQG